MGNGRARDRHLLLRIRRALAESTDGPDHTKIGFLRWNPPGSRSTTESSLSRSNPLRSNPRVNKLYLSHNIHPPDRTMRAAAATQVTPPRSASLPLRIALSTRLLLPGALPLRPRGRANVTWLGEETTWLAQDKPFKNEMLLPLHVFSRSRDNASCGHCQRRSRALALHQRSAHHRGGPVERQGRADGLRARQRGPRTRHVDPGRPFHY